MTCCIPSGRWRRCCHKMFTCTHTCHEVVACRSPFIQFNKCIHLHVHGHRVCACACGYTKYIIEYGNSYTKQHFDIENSPSPSSSSSSLNRQTTTARTTLTTQWNRRRRRIFVSFNQNRFSQRTNILNDQIEIFQHCINRWVVCCSLMTTERTNTYTPIADTHNLNAFVSSSLNKTSRIVLNRQRVETHSHSHIHTSHRPITALCRTGKVRRFDLNGKRWLLGVITHYILTPGQQTTKLEMNERATMTMKWWTKQRTHKRTRRRRSPRWQNENNRWRKWLNLIE